VIYTVGEFLRVIDLAGVFANALLGGIVAREQRMDPVGFVVLAILSGLGGGIIRDTLLQHGPPVALTDYLYVSTPGLGRDLPRGRRPGAGFLGRRRRPEDPRRRPGLAARGAAGDHHSGRRRSIARPGHPADPADLRGQYSLRQLRRRRQHRDGAVQLQRPRAGRHGRRDAHRGHDVPGRALAGLQLWQGLAWEYDIETPPGKRWPRIKVRVNRTPGRLEEQ
jgi:hypothetical protein